MKPSNDNYLYLAFSYNNKSIISWLVKVFTWSKYSHVALVDPKTTWAIEADNTHGVQYRLLSSFFKFSPPEIRRIRHKNPEGVIAAAKSQIGKRYDYGFVFGWFFRRKWQDQEKWACSELIAWAAEKAGQPIFVHERMNRIVPEHLFMVSDKTDAIKTWD